MLMKGMLSLHVLLSLVICLCNHVGMPHIYLPLDLTRGRLYTHEHVTACRDPGVLQVLWLLKAGSAS